MTITMIRCGWDRLFDGYTRSLRRRGRSEGTIRAYVWGMKDFSAWIDARGIDFEHLRPDDLQSWQDSLMERNLAGRTRQLATTAVRNALRWAAQSGYEFEHPQPWIALESVRVHRLLPRPLPQADVDRITHHFSARRPKAPLIWWRARAMWFYGIGTGARVSEMLVLDRDDLSEEVPIVVQKGGSQKALYAPDVALSAVWDYLRRRDDQHPALFVTHGNPPVRRLEAAGVREQWHALADELGIPRFTTHQLRHTCATELLDAGVPPEVVAAHLGHHGLGSLAGYGEVRRGRRQLAIDALQDRLAQKLPTGARAVVVLDGRGRRKDLA